MKTFKHLVFSLLIIIFALPIYAVESETDTTNMVTGFISDDLFIYMHAGPGTNYRILGTVNAGSEIKITGNSSNEYSEIIDDKNRKTWVETKYVSTKPGLRSVVAELNAQLASAADLNNQLDSQLNSIKATLTSSNDKSSLLNNEIATLKNQLASTKLKLKTQDTDIQKQWFFNGAMVLGIGLILGLLLPKLAGRKRNSIDSWK